MMIHIPEWLLFSTVIVLSLGFGFYWGVICSAKLVGKTIEKLKKDGVIK